MNILFVNLWALETPTSVSISNIGLILGMLKNGHHIDFLTGEANSHDSFLEQLYEEFHEQLHIIRIGPKPIVFVSTTQSKSYKAEIYKWGHRIYRKFSLFDHSKYLIKNASLRFLPKRDYDFAVSTSDPKTSHIYLGKLFEQGLKCRKWIQHWGDPLSIDITNNSIYSSNRLVSVEERIYAKSTAIVYVSPITASLEKELHPKFAEKIHFVPLSNSSFLWHNICSKQIKMSGKIKIGYFGNYNNTIRNIKPLYDFVRESASKYELIIAGESNTKLDQTNNITVLDRIPSGQISTLESECDLLVCLCNMRGSQIPGKIYYYSGISKPVLIILDGEYRYEIQEYFGKFGRYLFCDNNIASIQDRLSMFDTKDRRCNPVFEFLPESVAREILGLD